MVTLRQPILALVFLGSGLWLSPSVASAHTLPASCVTFTDASLAPQTNVIKAVHIQELRTCINALRAQRSIAAFSFTDSLIAQQTFIRAVHIGELRSALSAVYIADGLSLPPYESLQAGVTFVKANHVAEMRWAVSALSAAGTCSGVVSPGSITLPQEGGTGSFTITITAGCTWTVGNRPSWLGITPLIGSSSATLSYNATFNPNSSIRSATLAIAGASVPVTQAGTAENTCVGNVAPNAIVMDAAGGQGTAALTLGSSCTWTLEHNASWLGVSPASGTGNTQLTFTVAANTAPASRSTIVEVAGATFTIEQGAGSAPPSNVVILVNGSFNTYPPWVSTSSAEYQAIAATFGVEPIHFPWSDSSLGDVVVPYDGIYRGALDLAVFIWNLNLASTDKLHVVTHSHGGNVAKVGSYFVPNLEPTRRYRHLINLGTPVNFDFNPLGGNGADYYCQVSSYSDFTQFAGSSPQQIAQYYFSLITAVNFEGDALNALQNNDLEGYTYYSMMARFWEMQAEGWWLSTKREPGAMNILLAGGLSHGDLHEPPVWRYLVPRCVVP